MTTILYDHNAKQIACDGKVLRNDVIMGMEMVKWRDSNKARYYFAGCVADIERFLEFVNGNSEDKRDIDVSVIKIQEGKAYECGIGDEDGYWEVELQYHCAIGSGQHFALAALDLGKSARESVEYAATRDNGTGGTVYVHSLSELSEAA